MGVPRELHGSEGSHGLALEVWKLPYRSEDFDQAALQRLVRAKLQAGVVTLMQWSPVQAVEVRVWCVYAVGPWKGMEQQAQKIARKYLRLDVEDVLGLARDAVACLKHPNGWTVRWCLDAGASVSATANWS